MRVRVCVCVCVISQYFRGLIPNSEIKTADITSGYQKPQKYIQPLHSSVNWKKNIEILMLIRIRFIVIHITEKEHEFYVNDEVCSLVISI